MITIVHSFEALHFLGVKSFYTRIFWVGKNYVSNTKYIIPSSHDQPGKAKDFLKIKSVHLDPGELRSLFRFRRRRLMNRGCHPGFFLASLIF